MSVKVVEKLDESSPFLLRCNFVRNFDVTIDLNGGMIRIKDPKRMYENEPVHKILIRQTSVPIFLDQQIRVKPNQAVKAKLRLGILNKLINLKQVCLVHRTISRGTVFFMKKFLIHNELTECEWVVEHRGHNKNDTTWKKLAYALPPNTEYSSMKNLMKFKVTEFPLQADKACILNKKNKQKRVFEDAGIKMA